MLNALRELAFATTATGRKQTHPWRYTGNLDLQPYDLERLASEMSLLLPQIEIALNQTSQLAIKLDIPPPQTCDAVSRFAALLVAMSAMPIALRDWIEKIDALDSGRRVAAQRVADAGRSHIARIAASEGIFVPAALDAEIGRVRAAMARGEGSFWFRLGSAYRGARAELVSWIKAPLPKSPAARLTMVDVLLALQESRAALMEQSATAHILFGELWNGERTAFDDCHAVLGWFEVIRGLGHGTTVKSAMTFVSAESSIAEAVEVVQRTSNSLSGALDRVVTTIGLDITARFGVQAFGAVSLAEVRLWLEQCLAGLSRYSGWTRLAVQDARVRGLGGAGLADHIAAGTILPDNAEAQLRQVRAELLWRQARAGDVVLREVDGEQRSRMVAEFRKLEVTRRASVADMIRARHAAEIPRGARGEMGIIRGEIGRQRGLMPLRRLMGQAGRTIQKIKPVFLMSPISVAQFLPPGKIDFDLVVFDEASQVRPEDALGAIARGRQLVVVGDRRQLPPTGFFARVIDTGDDGGSDDTDDEATTSVAAAAGAQEMESILTLCDARGLPGKMLRWHYRSRHPSLIAVSNEAFYDGRLVIPPSPSTDRQKAGLVLHRVAGAYDRGRRRTNTIEAEAIVTALARHAAQASQLSIGIVAFSTVQRDLITDLIDQRRREDPVLDAFLGGAEPVAGRDEVFVKNLENVQGDERDVILISIGYGPRIAGTRLDSMAFGPVSAEGGERRLNVLFTRARLRCEVFVSFDPGDIDTTAPSGEGRRALKRFLMFAESGTLDEARPTGEDADSPFEEDVARVVRDLGYLVDMQVGSAGFRIDLAARRPDRPGRYILAIECDGATYHSALWARERDRLREDVLTNMGWRFHRIWSTDWFQRRGAEIAKLRAALEAAPDGIGHKPTPMAVPTVAALPPALQVPQAQVAQPEATKYSYFSASAAAVIGPSFTRDADQIDTSALARLIRAVIGHEGPMHADEVARRVATGLDLEHAGPRIVRAVTRGLAHLSQMDASIKREDNFWFTMGQAADCPVRSRAGVLPSTSKAEMLPPIEIRAALRRVILQNGGLTKDEAATGVTRLLGYNRVGPTLRARILGVITDQVARGVILDDAGFIRLAG